MTLHSYMVQLAPDEWGNELMREIALTTLQSSEQPAMVRVSEHAGWWLTFALDAKGDLLIVGTANDRWRPDEEVREWEAATVRRMTTVEYHVLPARVAK